MSFGALNRSGGIADFFCPRPVGAGEISRMSEPQRAEETAAWSLHKLSMLTVASDIRAIMSDFNFSETETPVVS